MEDRDTTGAAMTRREREALRNAADRMAAEQLREKYGSSMTRSERQATKRKGRKGSR